MLIVAKLGQSAAFWVFRHVFVSSALLKTQQISPTSPPWSLQMPITYRLICVLKYYRKSVGTFRTYPELPTVISDNLQFWVSRHIFGQFRIRCIFIFSSGTCLICPSSKIFTFWDKNNIFCIFQLSHFFRECFCHIRRIFCFDDNFLHPADAHLAYERRTDHELGGQMGNLSKNILSPRLSASLSATLGFRLAWPASRW